MAITNALQQLCDELGMTLTEFAQRFHDERAAMQMPIDFADLERRGVLTQMTGGWYFVLQPAALPAHVRKQASTVARAGIGTRSVVKVKFSRTRRG